MITVDQLKMCQELLGSSECSGPQTASTPGTGTKLGSVGR